MHQHKRTDDKWLRTIEKSKEPKTPIKKVPLKIKPKETTGEGILFQTLIATRKHVSFVSGIPIEVVDHSNCHHVLEKGRYPKFRLNFDNIVILTQREHYLIHHGTSEQRLRYVSDMFRDHGAIVKWSRLQYLKEKLIKEYGELKC
jgi:hypothetical protein